MGGTRKTAHQIRLHPTPEQEDYLRRAAGTRRFVYNWGLEQWKQQYAEYTEGKRAKPPTAFDLKQQFNAIGETKFPWTYDVTKCVIEGAFDDLDKAYTHFFAGRAKYPKFKKKHKSRESFYIANDKFTLGDHWLTVPVLGDFVLKQREATGKPAEKIRNRHAYNRKLGKVNLAEQLRFVVPDDTKKAGKRRQERKKVSCRSVKILGATIGITGGYWYVSIQVAVPQVAVVNTLPALGVDVGIKELAVVSDGQRFKNQKPLTTQMAQLKRLHRDVSRKQYDPETKQGSHNREKARQKLARLYGQITNIRADAQHKLTTAIATICSVVGLEDLHVTGMFKNRKLARALADARLGELRRLFETKMQAVGGLAVLVDRYCPSTKTCSQCGHVKKRMPLKYRTFICLHCGLVIDRDLNAAINLEREARRILRDVWKVPVPDSGSGRT